MAARSSSDGSGVISSSISTKAKVLRGLGRLEPIVGRRLLTAAVLLALVPAASADAKPVAGSWANPEIRAVTAAGLMGAKDVSSFRPNDPLTAQALENLVFDLKERLAPPEVEPLPDPTPVVPTDPTVTTDPTTTTAPTATTPAPEPEPPAEPKQVAEPRDVVVTPSAPVAVAGGITFRSLAAGGASACGVAIDGHAYCWGQISFGTLGDTTTKLRTAPVAVLGGLTFRSLDIGYETTCGVTDAGVGYCWGYNFGAVGDGSPDHRSAPTPVAGGLTFTSIAPGTGYSCGITTAASLYCWGSNDNGELGDGTIDTRYAPTPVRWPQPPI